MTEASLKTPQKWLFKINKKYSILLKQEEIQTVTFIHQSRPEKYRPFKSPTYSQESIKFNKRFHSSESNRKQLVNPIASILKEKKS